MARGAEGNQQGTTPGARAGRQGTQVRHVEQVMGYGPTRAGWGKAGGKRMAQPQQQAW